MNVWDVDFPRYALNKLRGSASDSIRDFSSEGLPRLSHDFDAWTPAFCDFKQSQGVAIWSNLPYILVFSPHFYCFLFHHHEFILYKLLFDVCSPSCSYKEKMLDF
jgi:hypothetical protein